MPDGRWRGILRKPRSPQDPLHGVTQTSRSDPSGSLRDSEHMPLPSLSHLVCNEGWRQHQRRLRLSQQSPEEISRAARRRTGNVHGSPTHPRRPPTRPLRRSLPHQSSLLRITQPRFPRALSGARVFYHMAIRCSQCNRYHLRQDPSACLDRLRQGCSSRCSTIPPPDPMLPAPARSRQKQAHW